MYIRVTSLYLMLAVLDLGLCLTCRHCRSDVNTDCNNAMTSSQYDVDCALIVSMNFNRANILPLFPDVEDGAPGGQRYCHRIELMDSTVIRTCMDSAPNDLEHTCTLLRGPRNGADPNKNVKRCAVCNTDACNAGQFDNVTPGAVPPPVIPPPVVPQPVITPPAMPQPFMPQLVMPQPPRRPEPPPPQKRAHSKGTVVDLSFSVLMMAFSTKLL